MNSQQDKATLGGAATTTTSSTRARALFITGTDTGVGKTVVGAALAAAAARRGLRVAVLKPCESGCSRMADGTLFAADAALLRAAASGARVAGREQIAGDDCSTCLYPFAPAVAPGLAAAASGVEISFERIARAFDSLCASAELVLVEGAGGLLVPLAGELTVADLAARLGAPLLIVGRSALGTINHNLLTLAEARRRGLAVAGVVLSQASPGSSADRAGDAAQIERLAKVPVLGTLPYLGPGPGLSAEGDLDALAAVAEASLPLSSLFASPPLPSPLPAPRPSPSPPAAGERPPEHARGQGGDRLPRLVAIMDRLLADDGCPWDREQTLDSLRPYLIEETYEVLEAMARGTAQEHCDELGDLLLQIVFQAALRQRQGGFSIDDVVDRICAKLVRRHPHVFGEVEVESSAEVLANWARIKAGERAEKGERRTLSGVPRSLPALLRAFRLTEKAARVGFDWPSADGARAKLDEEVGELDQARTAGERAAMEHELGDLLFAAVNLARLLHLDPEQCLTAASDRFVGRFEQVEDRLAERGRTPLDSSLEEMDALWEEAKKTPG